MTHPPSAPTRLVARAVPPQPANDRGEASAPVVLVLESTPPAGATLARYATDGARVSETWYLTEEEAQGCAVRDFGAGLGAWRPLPDGVTDPVAFALAAPPPAAGGGP